MSLPIFNFTKIESTNDFARSLITEHKIFKGIIIADEQTKGRGRYGNQWSSPKGNLYFTIFFPILRTNFCLLYTSPSPRDRTRSRMPSSA